MKANEYRNAVNAGTFPAPTGTTTKRTFTNAKAYRDYRNRDLTGPAGKKPLANITWHFFGEAA